MSSRRVLIIGAGGHAKVVIATLQAAGRIVEGIVDDNTLLEGTTVLGIPVIGPTERAYNLRHLEAIVAVGDNEARRTLVEKLNLDWTIAVHPTSVIHPNVPIGPGTAVFAGAVIQPGARVGAHTIVNTSATVDHDCVIGDFAHLAPGTHLGGGVWIEDGVFIGIAAVVIPNIRIGEGATLGAGAVAIRSIEKHSVHVGVPAGEIRKAGRQMEGPRRGASLGLPSKSAFIKPSDPRWLDVLSHTDHDVYHLPEYLAVSATYQSAEPLAFYSEEAGRVCLIPLLVKRFPERVDVPSAWCDLVSPYGYPCPLYNPSDGRWPEVFLNAFRIEADQIGACSAFMRLHPLFEGYANAEVPFSKRVRHGRTVAVDLRVSEEEMWRQTRDGHRNDIRRLQKQNFVPVMDAWELYDEFIRIYRETMLRRRADAFYCFPTEYFADLKSALGERLHLCLVLAPDGRLAAGGLFTSVNNIIEYHLSGSDSQYQRFAPTKLMLHFVRLWGKKEGYSVLHLGGGADARDDSLFQFKAGFSFQRRRYQTYRIVINENRFAALSLMFGCGATVPVDLGANFFPPYRQKAEM